MIAAPELPTEKDTELAPKAAVQLSDVLRSQDLESVRVQADGAAGSSVVVPRHAFKLFLEILGQMANGNAVTIVPVHAELTTQQAADILNVSRPFVVKLLETGVLPFHRAGSHRRIRAEALFAYRQKLETEANTAMAELSKSSQDLALHDL